MDGVHDAIAVCKGDLVADANGVRLTGHASIADINIVTSGEFFTGSKTECDIKVARCNANECMGSLNSIKVADFVGNQRGVTVGGVVVAGRVARQRVYSICGIVEPSGVAEERIKAGSYVLKSSRVVNKRPTAGSRVLRSGGVAKERTIAKGRVITPCGQVLERKIPFSGIAIGVASVRCRAHGLHHWRERNTCDRNGDNSTPQGRAAD
jgi:hypothetical protein